MKRLRDACRTNDVQVTSVLFLSVLCPVVGFTSKPSVSPWGLVVLCLVWPLIAFVGNLIDPIPEE